MPDSLGCEISDLRSVGHGFSTLLGCRDDTDARAFTDARFKNAEIMGIWACCRSNDTDRLDLDTVSFGRVARGASPTLGGLLEDRDALLVQIGPGYRLH